MLAAGLLRDGLVDRLAWFRAARIIGGDGVPAVAGFGLEALADAPRFRRLSVETVGEDVLEEARPRWRVSPCRAPGALFGRGARGFIDDQFGQMLGLDVPPRAGRCTGLAHGRSRAYYKKVV